MPTCPTDDRQGRQPEGLRQLCDLDFLEALSQHCKSAVNLCKKRGCLSQKKQPSTPLVLFLIFGCSWSSQSWISSQKQGSGRHLPDCSSHPREQRDGNRDLWGCSQLAETSAGPECHCIATQWSWTALPAWLWNYQGILAPAALDDPHLIVWITQDFLLQHIFAGRGSGMGLHAAQGGHAARKAPNPTWGGMALRWQLWHWIWPLNNIFSSCSWWEMKSKHFTSVF